MRIGSLFSGIGGLELGLEWAGLGPVVWQCELDPKRRAILERHWPGVERHGDVTTFQPEVGSVDLVCGGFPCQDVSVAGKGAGLRGKRSGLWVEFARVVSLVQPTWVVVENVHRGWRRWVPAVRRDLWARGYASVPFRVRACEVGAWHERSRTFVLAANLGSKQLRVEPGRSGRTHWKGALQLAIAGAARAAADPRPSRRARGERQARAQEQEPRPPCLRGRPVGGGRAWWAIEPDVERVVHGLPGRVDRVAALGDSVVPQCAEVVGRIIQQR